MTDVLREIFGDTKRVSILEEFIENWAHYLRVSEIARMIDSSEKTVYNHLHELVKIGLVEKKEGRAAKYRLRMDDKRAVALALIESEEYIRKIDKILGESEDKTKPYNEYYTVKDFTSPGKFTISSSITGGIEYE